jgi:hypothetical protein
MLEFQLLTLPLLAAVEAVAVRHTLVMQQAVAAVQVVI